MAENEVHWRLFLVHLIGLSKLIDITVQDHTETFYYYCYNHYYKLKCFNFGSLDP